MAEEEKEEAERPHPSLIERIHARRERHHERSKLYRAGWIAAGFLVIAAGVVLSGPGIPGPGILVIAAGLAMLALEFAWAERLLGWALERVDAARQQAAGTSPQAKVLGGIALVAVIAAAVAGLIVWDPPWLPI